MSEKQQLFGELFEQSVEPEEEKASFEQIFSELEHVVASLERGEQPLSESLRLFEEGIRLCRLGDLRLDEAERTVEQLLRDPETGESRVIAHRPHETHTAEKEVRKRKKKS